MDEHDTNAGDGRYSFIFLILKTNLRLAYNQSSEAIIARAIGSTIAQLGNTRVPGSVQTVLITIYRPGADMCHFLGLIVL